MANTIKGTAGTPSISAMQLRSNPGTVLDRVDYRRESFIIKRAGKPKAVLIPVSQYKVFQSMKMLAKRNLFKMIDKIQKRTSRYEPKEIQAAIDEATRTTK